MAWVKRTACIGSAVIILSGQAALAQKLSDTASFEANHVEFVQPDRRASATGNVILKSGDTILKAERVTLWLAPNASAGQGTEIQRAVATGGVAVRAGDDRASGDSAIYDFNKKLIVVSGNVTLMQSDQVLNGQHGVYDLNTRTGILDGGPGRVTGSFTLPPKH